MNDRFKFRVWNKEQNRFHHSINCDISANGTLILSQGIEGKKYIIGDDNYVVQQCTGLKDKNGKLIYEGDVVNQIYEDNSTHKCEVIYNNCSFQLKFIEEGKTNYINTPMYCYAINYLGHYTEKRLELIGNIYENKELLNDKC